MPRIALAFVLCLALSPALRAQAAQVVVAAAVVEAPDALPVLVGGLEGLHARVIYPPEAIAAGEQGTVYVDLVVSTTGEVLKTSVLRAPSERLAEAACAAVHASAFRPGIHEGKEVTSRMTLAVRFSLPLPEEENALEGAAPAPETI